MTRINSLSEESSSPSLSVKDIRTLVRLAPILMLVIALGGCKADPKLAACQIETAKIEGILKGVGIEYEPVETGNLQECLVANERVKGVMRGAAMKSDTIKVQLEALGVDVSFSIPAGKSHPELSGMGRSGEARKESGGSADLAYPELSKDFPFLASIKSQDLRSKFGEKPKFPASPINSKIMLGLAVAKTSAGQKWIWVPFDIDRLSRGFDPYTKRASWMPGDLYVVLLAAQNVKAHEEHIASFRPGESIFLVEEGSKNTGGQDARVLAEEDLKDAKREYEKALAELSKILQ